MKLNGSKQEQDFRKELEGSNIVTAQDGKAEAILNVLRTTFGEVKSAYILNWTPDQSEDIFTILVDLDIPNSFPSAFPPIIADAINALTKY